MAWGGKEGWGVFTFHYVSIKSYQSLITPPSTLLFTFHYVSIKSLSFFTYGLYIS